MYETEIIYKVAPRGGGKTKWLAERALVEQAEGNEIYLLTRDNHSEYDSLQFRRFMELFYANFNKLAPIHPIDDITYATEGSIVLIDDLLTYNLVANMVNTVRGKVKKIYIAVEGTEWKVPCECKCKKNKEEIKVKDRYKQLSINFDNYDIDE